MKRSRLQGFLVISLLLAAALALGVLVNLWLRDATGETEADTDGAARCRELAAGFDDYPLVWVGDEFEGLPLVGCERVQSAAQTSPEGVVFDPGSDFFNFYYGTCDLAPGVEACPVPLQVTVDPPCGPSLSNDVKKGTLEVRGIDAYVKEDGDYASKPMRSRFQSSPLVLRRKK